ncbi:ELKS/Rab6-interacting/CAST family member 1 [Aphelenchoides bicaudatus]|nr:ELKS/Rab6-interacting/CAST family member 1 [Aphelenchoides bicaudatus]
MLPYTTNPSGSLYSNTAFPTQRQPLGAKLSTAYNQAPSSSTHQQPYRRSTTTAQYFREGNSFYPPQTVPNPSAYYPSSQQYIKRQPPLSEMQQRRMEALQSMRKHRSLDGSSFLCEFNQPQFQTNVPPPSNDYQSDGFAGEQQMFYGMQPPAAPTTYGQRYGMEPRTVYGAQNYPIGYDDLSASIQQQQATGKLPHSFTGVEDMGDLKRENAALNSKLNYMMNSIKTFWSPELKQERQNRKDEAMRLADFQSKIMQQATEIQQIRNELDRREKDISQLLTDGDLLDMEDELRRLRQQLASDQLSGALPGMQKPRDYTEKSLSAPEVHTLKMKMERSEIALSDKQRELQNAEMRLKGAEEQNKELEKRLDIISRSGIANDAQLKLLQDDVNMLRSKLETRNQLIESKEKAIKMLEKDLDMLRQQLHESGQGIQSQDHRNSQLQIRIDQLETLVRERETELDRFKQRLLQQPNTRIEHDLQQRIENLQNDNQKLMESIDTVRQGAEVEKQQQKELNDRQVLLASQNEKISQFDTQLKGGSIIQDPMTNMISSRTTGTQSGFGSASNTLEKTAKKIEQLSAEVLQKELEEARNEVGHLLQKIQALEKDKINLQNKFNLSSYDQTTSMSSYGESKSDLVSARKTECSALKLRIEELEEALRESVGITSEREKQLNEQKTIIQQLSVQISDLYKDPTRRLKSTGKTDAEQKAWDEERQRYQRQLVNLRKEVTMASIREKDACIQLLQGPPDSTKEKIEILMRQKEQLRHRLLTQNSEGYSVSEGGPYLANVWMAAQQPDPLLAMQQTTQPFGSKIGQHRVQPSYSAYVHGSGGLAQNGIMAGAPTSQVSISIPPYGSVPTGPASFTFGTKIDSTDEGIWA